MPATRSAKTALTVSEGSFLRGGKPHRILAGSMHYPRVHPALWDDRLGRLAAMGLNTVDTYIPWNFHRQLESDSPDFTGGRDIGKFIESAGSYGLDVIVRPGPYICAEWDNGGFPAWLTARLGGKVRSSEPRYLAAVEEWFDALLPQLVELQASRGGPIVAVQIENEYGSYGDDASYLRWLYDLLRRGGITELLYTADGPTPLMLDGGTIPGVLSAATFGTDPRTADDQLRARRPDEPFFCAEFWNGWFDHWGGRHHVRSPANSAETLTDILDRGSVSIYMAHGGTNFGLWSGANSDGGPLMPTATSYDSDAPISEHGAITAKFHALRSVLASYGGDVSRDIPMDPAILAPQSIELLAGPALIEAAVALSPGIRSANPLTFDDVGLSSGILLYRAQPMLPDAATTITIAGLRDRAVVLLDGAMAGIVDEETATLKVLGNGRRVQLDVVVENQGRINYGPYLGQGKGILDFVQIDRRKVHGWSMHPLPLDRLTAEDLTVMARARRTDVGQNDGAGIATGTFPIDLPADTFLALPAFGKGFVWINGFLLGRYWKKGPQTTLYVPAPILKNGANEIVILELEHRGTHAQFRPMPDLGPREQFSAY